MSNIIALDSSSSSIVTGYYRVLELQQRPDRLGRPYRRVHLGNYEGEIWATLWAERDPRDALVTGDAVEAKVSVQEYERGVRNTILQIRPLVPGPLINTLDLIPRLWCPEEAWVSLEMLRFFVDQIEVEYFREFVFRFFLNEWRAREFVTCHASMDHHHAYSGGLLTHSTEVAGLCGHVADFLNLEPAECGAVILGGLFHDVGKLWTLGSAGPRPQLGRWVRHEGVTLEKLSSELAWLDSVWFEGGVLLRAVLTNDPTKSMGFPRFLGVDIIEKADQLSVARDRKRRFPTTEAVGSGYHINIFA